MPNSGRRVLVHLCAGPNVANDGGDRQFILVVHVVRVPNLAQAAGDSRAKAVRMVLRVVRPLRALAQRSPIICAHLVGWHAKPAIARTVLDCRIGRPDRKEFRRGRSSHR
jgi:hypothetical protein